MDGICENCGALLEGIVIWCPECGATIGPARGKDEEDINADS